ncbi:hypothetical protein KP509_03G069600 [Ceratopteris richardii]|uniref:Uncharacterized protein n=1 Tax=Ceratopteris richardii TaxID=49495 RepID=A0A8T2V8F7_CERRI|nr:hypothetical protein KP509_03G069600 [Ceratopteris richardii]
MAATSTDPAVAGGWDINSTQHSSPPASHFTSVFDIRQAMMDNPSLRPNINSVLVPPMGIGHNLNDILCSYNQRMLVSSNLGQPPIMGLRTGDPSYYLKELVPRSEDITSLFEQSRAPRRVEDDLTAGNSPPGGSISAPSISDDRYRNDADGNIVGFPHFTSRLLPMVSVDKNQFDVGNLVVKGEEEKLGAGENDDNNERGDDEDDGDDDDDDDGENDDNRDGDEDEDAASAWAGRTPTAGSVASRGMVVIRQPPSSQGSSPISCQDCGNQAKRDCKYMRCRTCCKSRGLPCETHVKSTWVPAYKRRQKQQLFANGIQQPVKILRSRAARTRAPPSLEPVVSEAVHAGNSSASTGTPPPSSDLNWLKQEDKSKRFLPPEAREQAVFKCVRIRSLCDGHEEFAYQASVNIGGRIYKGILYDQDVDRGQASGSSIAELCLGGRSVAS